MSAITKPCHFCASDDLHTFQEGRLVCVTCPNCGASGPVFDTRKTFNGMTAEQAAVKSHNERKAVQS